VQATPFGAVRASSANDEIIFLPFVVSVFPYDESLARGSDTFDHLTDTYTITNPQKIKEPNTALRRNFQDGLLAAIHPL